MYGGENHDIEWWVFAIDTHSVLSGSGQGDFAELMLRNGTLSAPVQYGQAVYCGGSPFSKSFVNDPGRSILEFHRIILTLAARLGLLARDLRAEYAQNYHHQGQSRHLGLVRRQQQVMQLQDTLRKTWKAHLPNFVAMGYSNESVSVQSRGIFEHVSNNNLLSTLSNGSQTTLPLAPDFYTASANLMHTSANLIRQTYALYNACIIYSHTSMWPHQRLEMSAESIPEMSQSVGKILHLGNEIIANGCNTRKFMVFPLFMAGVAARTVADQQLAVQLLKDFELNSIGKVMIATRQILETVYQKQREVTMQGGHPLMVDWVSTIAERGLQMIDARL